MYCCTNLSVGVTARRKPTGAVDCKKAAEIQDLRNAEIARGRVGVKLVAYMPSCYVVSLVLSNHGC